MNIVVEIECPAGRPTPDKHLHYIVNSLRKGKRDDIRLLSKFGLSHTYVISDVSEEVYHTNVKDIERHFSILYRLDFVSFFRMQVMEDFLEMAENLAE